MSKTLKQLLDSVNDEIGFDRANSYYVSQDPNIRTLVACAQRSAQSLRDLRLQKLVRQASIDLADGEDTDDDRIKKYSLPDDFFAVVPDTTYQFGRADPAQLPTPAETWAYLKSRAGPEGLRVRARIIDDELYVFSPDVAQTFVFEYISDKPVAVAGPVVSASATSSVTFTKDTDVWTLDDSLIELDIIWRYKQKKGLDWQSDKQISDDYQVLLRGRDQGAQTIYWPDAWPYPGEPYTNLWVDNALA